jgi:hypothetical protein
LCSPTYCDDHNDVGLPYLCKPPLQTTQIKCHLDPFAADLWCQGLGGGYNARLPGCANYGDEGTGEDGDGDGDGWEPSGSITYDIEEGVYYIEEDFVAEVKNDWTLLALDGSYVDQDPVSGYYTVLNVSPGDLPYALGLESRDILISVNEYDLNSLDDLMIAYLANENETEFVLEIERQSQEVRLSYEIVE